MVNKLLSFKDLRGFRKIEEIKELYSWEKQLGAGQFGTVHEAVHIRADEKCAVKVIHKTKVAEAQIYQELLK